MPHADSLITTLVAGFVLAFVFGMLANRLKLSPLVGYLIAGTLSLPHYWIDPLGPWLKVLPMMALCLFVAATDARR